MHLKVKSYYSSVNNQGITWYHHHRGTTHHHRFTRSKSRRTTVPTLKAAISWIYCSSNKHCHHQLHHLSALASIESQSWNSKVKKFPVPKYINIIAIASSRRRPRQSPVWHSATLVPTRNRTRSCTNNMGCNSSQPHMLQYFLQIFLSISETIVTTTGGFHL